MSRVFSLKCWPEPFAATRAGFKGFEIRENDRGYNVGDVLVLQEWRPDDDQCTGEMETREVTYIVNAPKWGLSGNMCVMSVRPLARSAEETGR